jgi:hypothetical protein
MKYKNRLTGSLLARELAFCGADQPHDWLGDVAWSAAASRKAALWDPQHPSCLSAPGSRTDKMGSSPIQSIGWTNCGDAGLCKHAEHRSCRSQRRAAVTVSFKPSALTTINTVANSGRPSGNKALDRLCRPNPVRRAIPSCPLSPARDRSTPGRHP